MRLQSPSVFLIFFTISLTAADSFGPDQEMNFRDWILEPTHAVNVRLVDNRAGNRVVEGQGSVLEVRLNHRAEAGPGNNGLVLQPIFRKGWSIDSEVDAGSFSLMAEASMNVVLYPALIQGEVVFWNPDLRFGVVRQGEPWRGFSLSVRVDELTSLPGGQTILTDGGPLVPGFLIRRGEGGTGQRALDVLVDDFDAGPVSTTDL